MAVGERRSLSLVVRQRWRPLRNERASEMQPSGISTAVFHLRHRILILIASPPILLLCIERIAAEVRAGEPWLNWLASFVLWISLLGLALRRRLVLTEDGLAYTDFLTTDHVPWAHVTRLETRHRLGIWKSEGLRAWTMSVKPKDLFTDLTQFSKSWRNDALGSILREKLPRLFQQSTLTKRAAENP